MKSQAESGKAKAESEIHTCHCEEVRRSNLKTITNPFVIASQPDRTGEEALLLSLRARLTGRAGRQTKQSHNDNRKIASLLSQ